MAVELGSEKAKPPTDAMTNGTEAAHNTLTRGLRDMAGRLRLGRGGNKAKRGSTPRNSMTGDPMRSSRSSSSVSSRSVSDAGTSLANLSDRLRRLQEDGQERAIPFRVKFVNTKGEATMADVYPHEEYNDVIQRITAKLRMTRHADYVLLYKDTDDEEIGVACSDNLREMFAIFEPGSRLQLRIVPFKINNSGALDSIAKIWEYGHTPNVFVSEEVSEAESEDIQLSDIKLASERPEMAERPKLGSQHMAVEDIADTAVAAAAATALAAAAAQTVTTDNGPSSTKPEPATSKTSAASSKHTSAAASKHSSVAPSKHTSVAASKNTSVAASKHTSVAASNKATVPGTPAASKTKDAEELRMAIMLMSTNLTLAIDSLGTKLTRNFDKLSDEQAKILESLKKAAEHEKVIKEEIVVIKEKEEVKDEPHSTTTTTTTTTTKTEAKDEKVEVDVEVEKDEKIEVDVEVNKDENIKVDVEIEKKDEVKVETKTETTTETKTEGNIETKVEETKTTTTTTKADEAVEVEVEIEQSEEKPEPKEESIKVKIDEKPEPKVEETIKVNIEEKPEKEEVVHVQIVEDTPPPPPPPPAEPKVEKIEIKVEQHAPSYPKGEMFRFHLAAANFAFHTNPYASSFFQRGFAETGMPGHFANPCMMNSPFECSSGCPCRHSPCSHHLSSL
ncbi:hypothetical protein GGF47_000062 [Coemansia sp. RSA 2524]|nr:hypothetical protein LPJ54_000031 [Coemansia sp. RSA 1824]KAJ2258096.1 hypothetical protein GGH98_000398 [Coemansia sp. RSA 454]KAJ2430373.1 hypothetical protein GGF47_000062 [Coemansia sp. RSA 2524]